MSCRILISTTVDWTSTARHAAGFALAGCEVQAVAPAGAPVTLSRHVSHWFRYRSLSPLASLRSAIAASRPDLIVSCDDRAMALLLRLHAREPAQSDLAAIIRASVGCPERYQQVMSREASLRAARELGIRVPETLPVSSEDALGQALKIVGLPAVLKADGTWGGEGVAIVHTEAEALAQFRKLSRPLSAVRAIARAVRRRDGHWLASAFAPQARAITLQRYILGHPAASAFAAWKGQVVGAVYYDVLEADGRIGPPSVIQRVDCPQIKEATERLAGCFGLSGLHGLDFIRDSAGRVHLLEINPRATQGGTLAFGPGRDLAAGISGYLSEGIHCRSAIPNDTVVFFPGEWLRNPESEVLASAHHDVPWDDPAVLAAALKNATFPPCRAVSPTLRNAPSPPRLHAPAMAG